MPEFYKYVQPFLLAELPPRKAAVEDALALVAMQRGAARGWHCWMAATKTFGFFFWTFGHRKCRRLSWARFSEASSSERRHQPVTYSQFMRCLSKLVLKTPGRGHSLALPIFFLSVQNHS